MKSILLYFKQYINWTTFLIIQTLPIVITFQIPDVDGFNVIDPNSIWKLNFT
jgi:hypothetical protein